MILGKSLPGWEMKLNFNRRLKILIQILLGILFLVSAVRFLEIVNLFGRNVLQMDFSAYYTAGQALNYGLSPYLNNLSNQPPLWDGIAHFRFSRFLYPPLAAVLFQPLALLPYASAKFVWMAINLACLIVSLYLTARVFPLGSAGQVFLVGIVVCLNYPLEAYLDRGQIDLVTLMLITAAILFMLKHSRSGDIGSGILLALATLLKLYCIFFLPFLLLKRRWQVLIGYVIGGLLLAAVSVILLGPRSPYDYVRYQLPRISGEATVNDALGKANKSVLDGLIRGVPKNDSIKDGRIYQMSHFFMVNYATLVTPIWYFLTAREISLSRTAVASFLFALLFGLFWLWDRRYGRWVDTKPREFLLWQIPVIIILLAGPITWVMNTVWLLTFTVILASWIPAARSLKHGLPYLVISLGLILVLLAPTWFGFLDRYFLDKAMFGDLIVLLGLIYYLGVPGGEGDAPGIMEVKSVTGRTGSDPEGRPALPAESV